MYCKTCDYPLWNLTTRTCPECGAPFRPGEFEFIPNAVQFCCPRCDQAYYGTDAQGRLVPGEFDCVRCGTHLTIDDMVLRPASGVSEERTRSARMPWFERRERGFFRSGFATIRMAMTAPSPLIRAVPETASPWSAWLFATTLNLLFITIGSYLPFVLMTFLQTTPSGFVFHSGLVYSTLGVLAGTTAGVAAFILIWAAVAHFTLRVSGGAGFPFRRTMHAICYSSGANATLAVPCCGPTFMVGPIWWVVSATLMLKDAQKVHGGRAALAVLAWPGVVLLIVIVLYAVAIAATMTMTGAGPVAPPVTVSTWETAAINRALLTHPWPPAHALDLAVEGGPSRLVAATGGGCPFIDGSTYTYEEDVPVPGGSYADFMASTPSQQGATAARAASALPPDVVAHRLGDFVFTYHGMDLSRRTFGLWTVVMAPDPDVNGPLRAFDLVAVATSDGNVRTMRYAEMVAQLEAQNQMRANAGLPPLPDPASVTHGAPAAESDSPQ